MKRIIKKLFNSAGFAIQRRDPLVESIPADYCRSPFLPLVYRGSLQRYLYFLDQVQRVRDIEGDIVECGVSIGHGALLFQLLSEYVKRPRLYWGFDSFEGFPDPVKEDEVTPIRGKGFWASPPEAVLRTLRDGRLREEVIRNQVRLAKGLFDDTLPNYAGQIALLHLDCDLYESYRCALEHLYGNSEQVPGNVVL